MITQSEATKIAQTELAKLGGDLVLIHWREVTYGWMYSYQYRRFIETGDPKQKVIGGPGPFLVNRYDSSVHYFGTGHGVDARILAYEQTLPAFQKA